MFYVCSTSAILLTHTRAVPPPSGRCRLCTANDRGALAEELAHRMWDSRRDREIDPPWENAGEYWPLVMRQFAAQALDMLRVDG
jgi:hypothetical protein